MPLSEVTSTCEMAAPQQGLSRWQHELTGAGLYASIEFGSFSCAFTTVNNE